jgi:hypothetical protein
MARQRKRHFTPGIEAFAHVLQHFPHRRIGTGLLQAGQGAHDGHAGAQQGMDLPREQQHVHVLDFLLEQFDFESGAAAGLFGRCGGRLDLHRYHAGAG